MGIGISLAGIGAGVIAAVLLPIGVRWLLVADAATCLLACVLAIVFFRDCTRPDQGSRNARRRGEFLPPGLRLLTMVNLCFAGAYLAILIFLPLGMLASGAPAWLPGLLLASGASVAFAVDRLVRPRLPPPRHRFGRESSAVSCSRWSPPVSPSRLAR